MRGHRNRFLQGTEGFGVRNLKNRVQMSSRVGIILLIAGAMIAIFAFGFDWVWKLFGPADLGPITLETLERRATPNDALACPPGVCQADSDLIPPVYAVGVAELKQAVARVIASEPNIEQVEDGPASDRYIQRSRWMHFPDTIVIRYFPRGNGQSTLALYSRSQLGRGDLGVNRARIVRWLDKLGRETRLSE
jgi:uncharacterized protein (DUF1499 family)